MMNRLCKAVYDNVIHTDGANNYTILMAIGAVINLLALVGSAVCFFFIGDTPDIHFWSGVILAVCLAHVVFFICCCKLADDTMHEYCMSYENLDERGRDAVRLTTIYYILLLSVSPVTYVYLAIKGVLLLFMFVCEFIFLTIPKALLSLAGGKKRTHAESSLVTEFDDVLETK